MNAEPVTRDRTEVELAPGIEAGAIVRCAETGRWRYDRQLRLCLGIGGDPEFETDYKAGSELRDRILPLSQIRESVRHSRSPWPKPRH